MSTFQGSELYQSQSQIVASMMAAYQNAIPDIWLGDDGVLNLIINIEAGQIEGLYLANQILLQECFIQTASIIGLQLWGTLLGVPQLVGQQSTGTVTFTGDGGVYIPIGSEVGYDPGAGGNILFFDTTQDGTIPNPGIPIAPSVVDSGTTGNPIAGTYEYEITFVTPVGETTPSPASNAVTTSVADQLLVTGIPLGGPGTVSRNVYRSYNGSLFLFVANIPNNTATTYQDNILMPTMTSPPLNSTAQGITVAAQSESPGANYNVVPGAITILSNVPTGLTSVTNTGYFTNGQDPESSSAYQSRLLAWIRGPQTGSVQDLENWAMTVPGVAQATCFSNYNLTTAAPGYATVLIAGPAGAIPSSAVVSQVLALLNSYTLAPITIVVSTFTPETINVTVTIYPASGYLTANLTPSVQQAITNYINSVDVGGTLYLSEIVAAVVTLQGINDVVVTAPTSNQTVTSSEKFVPGTLTVNGTP